VIITSLSLFACKKCGYEWTPRKTLTRFKRQCPKCNSYEIDATINASQSLNNPTKTPAVANAVSIARTNLPSAIYDLIGITGAVSSENAIQRAFELYRRLYLYKVKYNLENVEEVFVFLEKETLAAHKKANEAEKRLEDMLNSPELICYEVGGDLDAVHFFETLKERGYQKDFLGFVNEIIGKHFREKGWS
jgi:hypothetical protein